MNWLGNAYNWFWFHTEFWLTHVDRRPYTFIMRDWIFTHIPLAVSLMAIWFAGMFIFNLFHPMPASIMGYSSAFLLAHLVWGSKWIEGQQECPDYLGE